MTDFNKNISRFQILYLKYQENTISEKEMDELLQLSVTENVSDWIDGPLEKNWKEITIEHPLPEPLPTSLDRRRYRLKVVGWSMAASFVVIIITSIWFWNRDLGWEQYQTGYGETMEVVLSDNSNVLLNANSTIRWNADWAKAGERIIELTGEAFFDIARNEGIPLTVESKNATIRVLGTSFNVREDALGTDVYLYEGKIELELNPETGDSIMLMTTGDWIMQPAGHTSIKKYKDVTRNEAASWTEGELKFRNRPLGEILIRLEGIYGKRFEVQDTSLLSIPMDVGVPYANWEVMKSALELSLSVELEENGKTVKLKK